MYKGTYSKRDISVVTVYPPDECSVSNKQDRVVFQAFPRPHTIRLEYHYVLTPASLLTGTRSNRRSQRGSVPLRCNLLDELPTYTVLG